MFNGWPKPIKRALKRFVYYSPTFFKEWLIRRILFFSPKVSTDLKIYRAHTEIDKNMAFDLVLQAYKKEGFLTDSESIQAARKKLELENSHVLVAKLNDIIVGTLTLIQRVEHELPLERAFELRPIEKNLTSSEIISLAIHPNYRRAKGNDILFPLMKFMYEYAKYHLGIKTLFATCRPRESDFYEIIFLFSRIRGIYYVKNYLGAPAIALSLNLLEAEKKFKKTYSHLPNHKNLYKYFVEYQCFEIERF